MTPSNTHAIQVFVDNACAATEVPADTALQQWATAALTGLRQRAEIAIRIVDETESAALNRDYRQKHYATNVLSFPSELPESCEPPILGDLAICAAVVAREAQEQHKSLAAHWAHMVVHGVLHLLGHDHRHDREARRMERAEVEILRAFGYQNPYIRVVTSRA